MRSRTQWVMDAAAIAAGAIALAVVLDNRRESSELQAAAEGPVPLSAVWSGERRGRPPAALRGFLAPASYRELAAFRTRRATLVRVFTGRSKQDGGQCVGLRSADGAGMSCMSRAFANGVVAHVHQTTISGQTFVSGVLAPLVARFVASDERGKTREVEAEGAAFAFQVRSIAIVGAFDSDGRPLDR